MVHAQREWSGSGGGRVAAREVLLSIPAVSNLIREGKTFQIPSIMQTNRKLGMVTMHDALLELVEQVPDQGRPELGIPCDPLRIGVDPTVRGSGAFSGRCS